MTSLALVLLAAYLIGSIPTAVWFSRAFFKIDIREHGSRNAGATNTLRVLGWKAGVFVLAIDVTKGFVATRYAELIADDATQWVSPVVLTILAGSAAIFGHIFTIFAGFRGDKGVATATGVVLALFPAATLVAVVAFFLTAWRTRYVSFASLVGAATLPATVHTMAVLGVATLTREAVIFVYALVAFVFWTHRANLQRLLRGEELRLGMAKVRKD